MLVPPPPPPSPSVHGFCFICTCPEGSALRSQFDTLRAINSKDLAAEGRGHKKPGLREDTSLLGGAEVFQAQGPIIPCVTSISCHIGVGQLPSGEPFLAAHLLFPCYLTTRGGEALGWCLLWVLAGRAAALQSSVLSGSAGLLYQ